MPIFVWDQSFSVNVKQCDEQHQKLFAIANRLVDAMRGGKGQQVQTAIIAELAAYIATHFKAEEELMSRANYPGFAPHQREHRIFEAQVEQYKKEVEATGSTNSVAMLEFLKDWLVKHIKQVDHQYSPYLNEKGIR